MKDTHRIKSILLLSFCFFLLHSTVLVAQKKQKLLGYQGSINFGTALYFNNNENNRFNPFSWRIAGRQNIKLWKFNTPLRFLLSSAGTELDYSFSRIGITPRYKSYRIYLGNTSMNFSEYTLSRKNIFGVGVEGNPGIFRFGAMYGKIRNFNLQQEFIDEFGASTIRTFDRKAIGGKIGIGKSNNHFDLIAFKSIDNVKEEIEADTSNRSPNENFILGANLKLSPIRKISIQSSIAASGFTTDRRDDPLLDEESSLSRIYNPTTSSRLNFAGHAQIQLHMKQSNLAFKYKRVDPLYRSLGSIFFQNDLEEITGNISWHNRTNKLSVNSSLGFFRDNISKTKVQESRRWIGSLFISAALTSNLGFSLSLSNYQRTTEGQIIEFNDTLRQVSVSRNISLSTHTTLLTRDAFILKANGFIGFQNFNDVSGISEFDNSYRSYSSNLGFKLNFKYLKLVLNPSVLYSNYVFSGRRTERYGIRFSLIKQMLNQKIRLSSNVSYLLNDIEDKRNGRVLRYQAQTYYKINERNTVNLRVLGINRTAVIANEFSEYRLLFGYGLNF